MSRTPSISTVMNSDGSSSPVAAEFVAEHVSAGGQTGSSPPSWVPPAETGTESRHASASRASNLLTIHPPLAEVVAVGGGFASAKTEHSNTADNPEWLYLRSLLERKDFTSATDLCRERKMLARDPESCVRWAKDSAIVEAIQGNYGAAFDLLACVHYVAEGLEGLPRAKYEDELGLVLVEFGRTSLALSHFGRAITQHRAAGYLRGCAAVRHNAGRAYAARGEHGKAMRNFTRALEFARSTNDYRLERKVCESIEEFTSVAAGEGWGR